MLAQFTAALPHFLAYFGAALALAVVFLFLYSRFTPHREFELIGQGNAAAATQLGGTFLGFAVPMALVIGSSGIVVLASDPAISRILFKAISDRIAEGCMASGLFVGSMGLGVGILQAACMLP